jgi:hypothetical protein
MVMRVPSSVFCVLFCVNVYYCHRVSTQLQLNYYYYYYYYYYYAFSPHTPSWNVLGQLYLHLSQ